MSPLAKQVIDSLSQEKDNKILGEVLDFYEYLKEKRKKNLENDWDSVEEDAPTDEEINIINSYIDNKSGEENLTSLDLLAKELGANV